MTRVVLVGAFALVFTVGCNENLPATKQGVAVGVLAASPEQPLYSIEAALDLINSAGLLVTGQLYLEVAYASELGTDGAFRSLADDPDVKGVISLMDATESAGLRDAARERGLFVSAPIGTEWWTLASASDEQSWLLGMIGSTAGMVGAVGKLIDADKLACPTLGVIVRGTAEQRSTDEATMKVLAENVGVTWQGLVSVEDAEGGLWDELPACIVAERGTHLFAAQLALRINQSGGEERIIFANARGVEEFEQDPDAVDGLAGHYTLVTTNGPVNLSDTSRFEEVFLRVAPAGVQATWYDAHFFDGFMPLGIALIVRDERDAVPELFRRVSTLDVLVEFEGGDTPFPLSRVPNGIVRAVEATAITVSDAEAGGADYSGATGTLDFPDGRPVPFQSYTLRLVEDYVEGSFQTIGNVFKRDEGTEYSVTGTP